MITKSALQYYGISIENFLENEQYVDGPSTSKNQKCKRAKHISRQHRTKLVTLV